MIDESGLRLDGLGSEDILEVIDDFLVRFDVARERDEPVARSGDIYDAPVTAEIMLYTALFEDGQSPIRDVDLRRRLQHAIDRSANWEEDSELIDLLVAVEVEIDTARVPAVSLALAHACRALPHTVGCLNFRSSGRVGKVAVVVGGESHELHFVVDEASHRQMFRDAVSIEDMNENTFAHNASSAFPDLVWADELWSGLNAFRRPYREQRSTLTLHLGVLDDFGAQLFDELMSTHPEQIGARLDALGVRASDESGRTKQDKRAKKDRTRALDGVEMTFWWHTKLLPNIDRVHFSWRRSHGDLPSDIVIGLFTDHCHTPK